MSAWNASASRSNWIWMCSWNDSGTPYGTVTLGTSVDAFAAIVEAPLDLAHVLDVLLEAHAVGVRRPRASAP